MAGLSLSLLGPFQAILDGEPATGFESNKVKALLAYLAVEADRPHPRETLAGLLWPDYPDRSALNNLRSALANLRQAIGDRRAEPPFLLITRDTIQFNTASDYSLDLAGLQHLPGLNVDQLEQARAAQEWERLERDAAVSGQPLLTLAGHLSTVIAVAASPDNVQIATSGYDGTVKLWDTTPGRELLTMAAHDGPVYGIAYSPDGSRLATASLDGTVKLWDPSSGLLALSLSPGSAAGGLTGIAFSPDGLRVFTGGNDGYVREWDATTGQELRTFSGEEMEVYGIALSLDGKRLAIGRQDGVVTVWDVSSGDRLFRLSGHAGLVLKLAFSLDGTRLATASFDKFAKVWDVQTGQELMTLYGNISNVFGVSFSRNGRHVATAGGDGTARIYTLDMDELTELAHSRITRPLTTEECHTFLHLERCPHDGSGHGAP